jgi:hypothetical protein
MAQEGEGAEEVIDAVGGFIYYYPLPIRPPGSTKDQRFERMESDGDRNAEAGRCEAQVVSR